MYKKSSIEMERQKTAKILRGLIRLKHSIAADEELNDRLPDILQEFDEAIQAGELKTLSGSLDKVLGG